MARFVAILPAFLLTASVLAQGNPFQPPAASIHYAPDRTFDLKHIALTLDIDYPDRTYSGTVKNYIAPLRNGLTTITIHAWEGLTFSSVMMDGKTVAYKRDKDEVRITCPPTIRGKVSMVMIKYSSKDQKGGHFATGGGWHWIEPNDSQPGHVGFWTQGESMTNRQWCPTWDYPNDFTTSETVVTVDKDWSVIGNGKLVSNVVSGNRRTWRWKMDLPHATYLLSLAGGPFDIAKDNWEGVELWYVVPKGKGDLIPSSFGDTKDMLSFFSKITGVKYAWPKYAQDAMYDFGGGMENVSATTLGEGALTDERSGFWTMSSLNSHELGHQWFGDFVTCKDWSHIWLNESFATYMQIMYFEHAQGAVGYADEIENAMQSYFREARRYHRPIDTKMYPNADAMFDSHTYPKGGCVLHTLRQMIGDEAFFNGLREYLTSHAHTPVVADDLCQSMTDASGISLEWFWDQWIYKPGHPVIEYDWSYNDSGEVVLKVRQTQDTADGTPIYKIPTKVGFIVGSQLQRQALTLSDKEQEFKFKLPSKPSAVILDPDHDFLREMKHTFADDEMAAIAQYGSNPIDRRVAMAAMLRDEPTADEVAVARRLLANDNGVIPVFPSANNLIRLKNESLRSFFRSQLTHKDFNRRADGIRGLAALGMDEGDRTTVRAMVNEKQPYSVIFAALQALDIKTDFDVFLRAGNMDSLNERIRNVALPQLAESGKPEGAALVMKTVRSSDPRQRVVGVRAMCRMNINDDIKKVLSNMLKTQEWDAIVEALRGIRRYEEKSLKPNVEALNKKTLPANVKREVDSTLRTLGG